MADPVAKKPPSRKNGMSEPSYYSYHDMLVSVKAQGKGGYWLGLRVCMEGGVMMLQCEFCDKLLTSTTPSQTALTHFGREGAVAACMPLKLVGEGGVSGVQNQHWVMSRRIQAAEEGEEEGGGAGAGPSRGSKRQALTQHVMDEYATQQSAREPCRQARALCVGKGMTTGLPRPPKDQICVGSQGQRPKAGHHLVWGHFCKKPKNTDTEIRLFWRIRILYGIIRY